MFVACDHLPCCLWILRILLVSTQKDSLFLKLLEKKYLCNIIVKFLTHVRYVIGNIMISLWSMVFLCKKKKKTLCLILFFGWCFWFGIYQVNVVSYKTRPAAKDFIQVEIVVEKNSQKIILIGKVSIEYTYWIYQMSLFIYVLMLSDVYLLGLETMTWPFLS